MIRKKIKIYLIVALVLISALGLTVHLMTHNPHQVGYGYLPLVTGIISTFGIPLLFCFRRTLHLANLLNGFTAIIGTVAMSHFMVTGAPMYIDIGLLIAKFMTGVSIFLISLHQDLNAAPSVRGWNLIRYPNMGFWYAHLILLGAVFTLGHIFWR